MNLADRVKDLHPTGAFIFLQKAKEIEKSGKPVIHLEIGEPDLPTPENIKEAGIKAIRENFTKYTIAQGIPELRKIIAEEVIKTRNIDVSIDEVVVGLGASSIIYFSIFSLINSGDEVMYPDPGFFTYKPVTLLCGGIPKPYHLIEEKCFSIDVDEIKSKLTKKTKLIIVNSPHNPTGGIINDEDLKELAAFLVDKDVYVLSDEVYSKILYEGSFKSIASYPGMKEKTIIVDGFSKTYSMTGWRLGYGVMNKDLAYKVTALLVQCNSCTPPFVQLAGIEALNCGQNEVKNRLEIYRERRDLIYDGINEIEGFSCVKPKGAFYIFPNISAFGMSCEEFVMKLLNEVYVASLPGTAFGDFAKNYIRFTYCLSKESIKEAIERIKYFRKKLKY